MLSDKKMFLPVFLCIIFLLAACLFYALPRVKENYLSTGQITITSDTAVRFGSYLNGASTLLYDLAAGPNLISMAPSRGTAGLSLQVKDYSPYFSDFFLIDSSGEILGTSGSRRVLPLSPSLFTTSPGDKGTPFPVMLTEISGVNFPGLVVPVKYGGGRYSIWLAGALNTQIHNETFPVRLSEREFLAAYISDRAGNIAALSPVQDHHDVGGAVRSVLSTPGTSAVKQEVSGGMMLTAAGIGDTGWSVVCLRSRGSLFTYFSGDVLKTALFIIILSSVLLALYLYYIRIQVKPVNQFIDHLSNRFQVSGENPLEDITSKVEAICGNMNLAESMPIGVMVVDLEGVIKFFNREAGEITGFDPLTVTGKPMIKYFPNNYYNYTMECMQTGREYLGLRNIIKSGDFFKELLLNISPIYNQETVSGAVATFEDVTPQRKMLEVHTAYTLARDMASQKDLDSTIKIIAGAAAEMVEIEYTAIFLADSEGNLVITSWHGIPDNQVEIYNASPYSINSPEIIDLYRNKTPLIHGDVRNRHNLKPMLILPGILSFYSFPVVYENKLIGLVNLYSSEKNKLSKDRIYLIQTLSGQVNTAIINFYEFQKMRLLASMDGLTGLFNKKHFFDSLEEELKQASSEYPLSLAIFDIDHLKAVNESYGHQIGDQVIKEISRLMAYSVRETDRICRYSGKEIAVFMPGTGRKEALDLADKLRLKIEKAPILQTNDSPLYTTVSAGVSTYPQDGQSIEQLVSNSASALCTAKERGCNTAVACS